MNRRNKLELFLTEGIENLIRTYDCCCGSETAERRRDLFGKRLVVVTLMEPPKSELHAQSGVDPPVAGVVPFAVLNHPSISEIKLETGSTVST